MGTTSTTSDGAVIPAHLEVRESGGVSDPGNQTNLGLRLGEVVAQIPPESTGSRSHKYFEYDVRVVMKDGNGPTTVRVYKNCLLTNLFGGVADRCSYALRAETADLGNGSKVTLLCVNGDTPNAVIIGGVNDPNDTAPDVESKQLGQFLSWRFNGVTANIDDDGELFLGFTGKTNADNSLASSADPHASGSGISLLRDGSVNISGADQQQGLFIDQTNNQVVLTADTSFTVSCNGTTSIQSQGLTIGGGTDALPLFTTYRTAEDTVLVALSTALTQLLSALTTISVTPAVVGAPVLTPASLVPVAQAVLAATSAISAFEAQATTYLSQKNFND